MKLLNWTLLSLLVASLLPSAAQAYEPDPVLMTIQGYSPEMVRFTTVQKQRQEWKEPPPPSMTPKELVIHNFIYNDWLGSYDEFGYEIIREP